MLMLPVPANRSKAVASSRSMRFARMLKRLSLAKSVLGRALNVLGTSHLLCLYIPLITLNGLLPVTRVVVNLHATIAATVITILKQIYNLLLIQTTIIAVRTKVIHEECLSLECM